MKLSAIYKIRNKKNGKVYIGSTNDVSRRWRAHKYLLKMNKHQNIHLQNSYNKHGEDIFEYEIIKEVDEINLLKEEQIYINDCILAAPHNIYNIATTAGSPMKGATHTEETKQKLRKMLSGVDHPHYGKEVSEEWRRNISKAKKRFTDEEELELFNNFEKGVQISELAIEKKCHMTTIRRVIDRVSRFIDYYV